MRPPSCSMFFHNGVTGFPLKHFFKWSANHQELPAPASTEVFRTSHDLLSLKKVTSNLCQTAPLASGNLKNNYTPGFYADYHNYSPVGGGAGDQNITKP